MNKTNFNAENKKPDIEINKPGESKFWQQPNFSIWIYAKFMVVSFYFWQGYFEAKKQIFKKFSRNRVSLHVR